MPEEESWKEYNNKKPSYLWYLLPVIFSIFGGIVGYFLLRKRDQKFAERVLLAGLIVYIISIISLSLISAVLSQPGPGTYITSIISNVILVLLSNIILVIWILLAGGIFYL